jgi:hypothetical protein
MNAYLKSQFLETLKKTDANGKAPILVKYLTVPA